MNVCLEIPESPIVLNTRNEPEEDGFIKLVPPERIVHIAYSNLHVHGPYSFTDTEHGLENVFTQWHGRCIFGGSAIFASIRKQDGNYVLAINFIDNDANVNRTGKRVRWDLKVGLLTESDMIKANVLIDRIREYTRGRQYYTPEISCLPTNDVLVYEKNKIVYVDECCFLLEVAGEQQAFRINHEESEPKIAEHLKDIEYAIKK